MFLFMLLSDWPLERESLYPYFIRLKNHINIIFYCYTPQQKSKFITYNKIYLYKAIIKPTYEFIKTYVRQLWESASK